MSFSRAFLADRNKQEAHVIPANERGISLDTRREAERIVLNRYAPASVVVGDTLNMPYFLQSDPATVVWTLKFRRFQSQIKGSG